MSDDQLKINEVIEVLQAQATGTITVDEARKALNKLRPEWGLLEQ